MLNEMGFSFMEVAEEAMKEADELVKVDIETMNINEIAVSNSTANHLLIGIDSATSGAAPNQVYAYVDGAAGWVNADNRMEAIIEQVMEENRRLVARVDTLENMLCQQYYLDTTPRLEGFDLTQVSIVSNPIDVSTIPEENFIKTETKDEAYERAMKVIG